jgi:hypothetical protein
MDQDIAERKIEGWGCFFYEKPLHEVCFLHIKEQVGE